jgi:AcrR family transcriptional regulator
MPVLKKRVTAGETPRKLIDAARVVFAERGLHAATIREIPRRAGDSVAAVNYRFRNKFELYPAVVHSVADMYGHPVVPASLGDGPATVRLRRFIRHILRDMLGVDGRLVWEHLLKAPERVRLARAIDDLIDTVVRPLLGNLEALPRSW